MPWQNTKNKYPPKGYETKVGIPLDEVKRFKELFYNQSIYDFYVMRKTVYGKHMILYIRSLRINEFLDLMDEFDIPWDIMDHIQI